jgi:ATP-dependent exoDNAse (exonuclease V) beta subunit
MTASTTRPGRFGPDFGETVHRALGLSIRNGLSPVDAVERASRATGMPDERLADAAGDVERAIAALRHERILTGDRSKLRLEYAVGARVALDGSLALGSEANPDRAIVSGYIDLLALRKTPEGEELVVIDFKTDPAPTGGDEANPAYLEQVGMYARIVGCSGMRTRAALLFTETGRVLWT